MQTFVEIKHSDVAVTAWVHPATVAAHRRAGWTPVAEDPAATQTPQPDPAGSQDAPVAGAPDPTEE